MQKGNQFNRFASGMILVLIVCLLTVSPVWPNTEKDRKNAAKSLAREIQQGHFQKVYIADFLDPSKNRDERGCFFSSVFSTNLAKIAQDFAVVNRIDAQKKLDELHISAQDLQQPEVLARAATTLGVDAVLMGLASISSKDARLSLSLRDAASDKEIYAVDYHEKLEPFFEGSFPAGQSEGGHLYYFPGMDGISQPKCIFCPNPDYTDEARRNGAQGSVILSVLLDERGMIKDVRLVSSSDDSMTKQCLDILKKWRMKPSEDANGNSVPIRAPIEITFRLLG